MKRYCLALDLVDDPTLIEEYEHWHKAENGWPEIKESITDAGITDMQIYRTGNNYSGVRKAAMDASNPKVQEWEQLMWKFQQPLPWAKEGEKWILMDKIFQL